jgi:hypothetical protein
MYCISARFIKTYNLINLTTAKSYQNRLVGQMVSIV